MFATNLKKPLAPEKILSIFIHQTWQIINPLQERAQQLLDELHVVFKDWVTKRRGERIKHDKGWVHSLI